MTDFNLGHVVGSDGEKGDKGDKGDTGAAGNGISKIELHSTSGKAKTYRVTYTNGSTFDFIVNDGDDATVTIVTSFNSTTSDSKVPSEKLTKTTLDTKVDKVTGKDLSTNDFTNAYKSALDGLSSTYVAKTDIVDNLTTNDATKVLSAKQGKALKDLIGNAITYINQ